MSERVVFVLAFGGIGLLAFLLNLPMILADRRARRERKL